MNETNGQKRAPPTAVEDRRQVKAALAAVSVGLNELQQEAVFLNAGAKREGHQLDHRLESLRKSVGAVERQLDTAVAALPMHRSASSCTRSPELAATCE